MRLRLESEPFGERTDAWDTVVRFVLGLEEPPFPEVDHFAKLKSLDRVTAPRFALEFSAVAIKYWLRWRRSTIEGGPFERLLCFTHDQVRIPGKPSPRAGHYDATSFLQFFQLGSDGVLAILKEAHGDGEAKLGIDAGNSFDPF